jgi:autophagy-related protein 5
VTATATAAIAGSRPFVSASEVTAVAVTAKVKTTATTATTLNKVAEASAVGIKTGTINEVAGSGDGGESRNRGSSGTDTVAGATITRLRSSLWRGHIPIELCLDSAAIAAPAGICPESVFILASRNAYLPAVAEVAVEVFRMHAIELNSNVWFESGCNATGDFMPPSSGQQQQDAKGTQFLRVNLPIGVLFDLFGGQDWDNIHPIAPWKITVHFDQFPVDALIRCQNSGEASKLYSHSLKQALFLLHGSTRAYNELSKEHRQALWDATTTAAYENFEVIANDLFADPINTRIIPVRILSTVWTSTLQRPFAALDSSTGQLTTVQTIFDIVDHHVHALSSISGSKVRYSLVVQGIVLPKRARLYDIWRVFCHADLFLYVCVVVYK